MPGIVGLFTKLPRERVEPQLLRMLETLRHEPSYITGTWIDEHSGVYLGWAVRKNSFADGMPLRNEQGNVVLVFSGEEYPQPGTAEHLKEQGHSFATEGPSYLVHLYEEDARFPVGLNGRFQGVVTDRTSGTATLFNDRYGMHRMYYHESKKAFYFAAEAKAILEVRPELRTVNPQSLGEFVACGCVLENRTLFDGIAVLPPGSAWIFRDGLLKEKNAYFHPEDWEKQTTLDPETYFRELRDTFARNLPRYFKSTEPIGISVTGGLDTRMILSWHKPAPGSLPCYSFGGSYRNSQDVTIGRRVADACGQAHEVIPVGSEFLSRFPHYAERTVYLTDGCADVSRSADLFVNEKARAIAPVRMTGNYGGEVLRAIRAFKPVQPTPGLFHSDFLPHVQSASKTYAGVLLKHPVSFSVFRQAPWHHYGLLALEQTQLSLRSPFLDNDLVRTVFRSPESAFANNDVCLRLIAEGSPTLGKIRTDRGLAGTGNGVTSAISQALLEFTFKAEYAYDYGMPNWVTRIDHAFSPLHLERLFLGRHKFCHFRVWYRDALSSFVRETLLNSRALSRPYLEKKGVETIVNEHLKSTGNYTLAIHKLLTLELLHRTLVESRSSATIGEIAPTEGF